MKDVHVIDAAVTHSPISLCLDVLPGRQATKENARLGACYTANSPAHDGPVYVDFSTYGRFSK